MKIAWPRSTPEDCGLTALFVRHIMWPCKPSCSESANRRPAEEADPLYHYVVVRRDLEWPIIAVQIAHAAGESSPGGLTAGTNAVICMTPNEGTLKALAVRLQLAGVPFVRIEEPDAPYNGALMAIGCVPGKKEVLRRSLSSLPLLR